ncbi:MAG: hypothetical protein QM754_12080 [Tepidisphaeraceae bacterium]
MPEAFTNFDPSLEVLDSKESILRAIRLTVASLNEHCQVLGLAHDERAFPLSSWQVDEAVAQLMPSTIEIRRRNEMNDALAYCRKTISIILDHIEADVQPSPEFDISTLTWHAREFIRQNAELEDVVAAVWSLWDFFRGLVIGGLLTRVLLREVIGNGLEANKAQRAGGRARAEKERPRRQMVANLCKELWPKGKAKNSQKAVVVQRRLIAKVEAANRELAGRMSPLFPLQTIGHKQILNYFKNDWSV